MSTAINEFLNAITSSLEAQAFVKLTLGKPQSREIAGKVSISRIDIRDQPRLRFVSRFAHRDRTEHFSFPDALHHLAQLLGKDYRSAHLFTLQADLTLVFNKRGEGRILRARPTHRQLPSTEHNRLKDHAVGLNRPYLASLEVTTPSGDLKPSMAAKYKQITRFIEIFDGLLDEAGLKAKPGPLSLIDIGSGKGYLTFALYDHLNHHLQIPAAVRGIELRSELVALCRSISRDLGFELLSFEALAAGEVPIAECDVVIALHACDTATDDALYRGIQSGAAIILVAPCCQHELAPQLAADSSPLRGIHRFGLLKQRQADLVTDASRALLLEAMGYRVKVIEFVSTEHTQKNLLLAAIRTPNIDRSAALAEYRALKKLFGFRAQALESRLGSAIDEAVS